MITDTEEFIDFDSFRDKGVITTDTWGIWRKKDNGLIDFVSRVVTNTSDGDSLSINSSTGLISIKDSGIVSSHLSDGSVIADKLGTNAVTTAKIASNAITESKIGANAITTSKIADSNITTAKIADSSVTETKIGSSAVTNAKISNLSVTEGKIASNAITTTKIADSSVTTSKIADSSITNSKVGDNAITETKIESSAVTTSKIADSSITTSKIADRSITKTKIGVVGSNIPVQIVQKIVRNPIVINAPTRPPGTNDSNATLVWSNDGIADFSKSITIRQGSKVRISGSIGGTTSNGRHGLLYRVLRNGVTINLAMGTGAGLRTAATGSIFGGFIHNISNAALDFIDEPILSTSTGTVTYSLQFAVYYGVIGYINHTLYDTNHLYNQRTISTITLTELS